MTIGIIVRARRKQLGWTQNELAEKAGVAQPLISRLESGRGGNITIDNLRSLALALGCSVIDLLPEQDRQSLPGKREKSRREAESLSIESLAKGVSEIEKLLGKNENGRHKVEGARA